MGKGFGDKTYVYCGAERAASTADRVIARGFFLESCRLELPKVALARCIGAHPGLGKARWRPTAT
jgi:hypothetical protein